MSCIDEKIAKSSESSLNLPYSTLLTFNLISFPAASKVKSPPQSNIKSSTVAIVKRPAELSVKVAAFDPSPVIDNAPADKLTFPAKVAFCDVSKVKATLAAFVVNNKPASLLSTISLSEADELIVEPLLKPNIPLNVLASSKCIAPVSALESNSKTLSALPFTLTPVLVVSNFFELSW